MDAIPVTEVKATRQVERAPLNPDGREMRRMEREAEARLAAALQSLGRRILIGLKVDDPHKVAALIMSRTDNPDTWRPFRDVLIEVLKDIAQAGAAFGRKQVEREIMGVRKAAPSPGFGIDWELANNAAAEWAQQYGYSLVGGMQNTTRQRLANEVRYFVDNGLTVGDLRKRVMNLEHGVFSASRAQTIAVTEVTRAYAEGNIAAWKESGVVQAMQWNTANDELACPICGRLGKAGPVPIGQGYGRIARPPAHPNCRCWLTPVTDAAELQDMEQYARWVEVPPATSGGAVMPPRFSALTEAKEWIAAQGGQFHDDTQGIIDAMWRTMPDRDPAREAQFRKNWSKLLKGTEASPEYSLKVAQAHADALARGGINADVPVLVRKSAWEASELLEHEKWAVGEYKGGYINMLDNPRNAWTTARINTFSDIRSIIDATYETEIDNLRGVLIHEYGHHVTLTLNPAIEARARGVLEDVGRVWIKQNVSVYASTNSAELAAETYALRHHPLFNTLSDDVKRFALNLLGES